MLPLQIQIPLPLDITNIILEYIGYHKCRSGCYMKQIVKISAKYRVIKILFDKIVRNRNNKSYAVLRMSPLTKYVVVSSGNYVVGRL
jgi:hypothetical protein